MVIVTGTSPKVARNLCTRAVRDAKTVNPEASEMACFFHPGEGGDSANAYTGRLLHEGQPLTLLYTILTAVNALSIK